MTERARIHGKLRCCGYHTYGSEWRGSQWYVWADGGAKGCWDAYSHVEMAAWRDVLKQARKPNP